ncbi:uncharacterized protein LOC141849450 isoform X1 [Brevipalpus obovatus]|uniref:uncharacterized protein LOC141849450 isoform X1 n=1 Tax=Brevipalpus obovatus TaxID=246614 RepID=UPI003D9F9C8A
MKLQLILVALSITCGLARGSSETAKSDTISIGSPVAGSPNVAPSSGLSSIASAAVAPGPEARQVPSSVGSSGPSLYPYNLYQNSLNGYNLEGSPSSVPSTSSMLSFLRSPQGGRRSSLTNRLRNLMNSIFFKDSSSPYMTSGSSYSFAYRPPPHQFPGFSSGLQSSMPSGYSPSSANFLNSAASAYRPVVFPQYPGSSSGGSSASGNGLWSNYKQWSSGSGSGVGPSGSGSPLSSSIGNPGGANYAWISSSSLSGPQSSGSPSSSLYSSGDYAGGSNPFQVAASNSYASSYPSSGSGTSYQSGSQSPYQRSSVVSSSNFKPVPSTASASAASQGSPSSPNFKQ